MIDASPPPVLQSSQQMEAASALPDPKPPCVHRWRISSNDSPEAYNVKTQWGEYQRWLPGVCTLCGEKKDFPADNYIDTSWMWNNKGMR